MLYQHFKSSLIPKLVVGNCRHRRNENEYGADRTAEMQFHSDACIPAFFTCSKFYNRNNICLYKQDIVHRKLNKTMFHMQTVAVSISEFFLEKICSWLFWLAMVVEITFSIETFNFLRSAREVHLTSWALVHIIFFTLFGGRVFFCTHISKCCLLSIFTVPSLMWTMFLASQNPIEQNFRLFRI